MRRLWLALALLASLLIASPAYANVRPYYYLPWEAPVGSGDGEREVKVGNNQGSHQASTGTKFAWDFDADVDNWQVRAARTGTVVAFRDTKPEQPLDACNDPNTSGLANYVRIVGPDGDETLYTHLMQGSVSALGLTVGQTVVRHSIIGRTDNSGRSCGDHLHYQVQENCVSTSGFCTSIASSFLDADVIVQDADGIPHSGGTYVSGNLYEFENPPTYPGQGWSSPFVSLGKPTTGDLTSGMQAASWEQGRVDVFARGTTNKLEHALRTSTLNWVWDGTLLGSPPGLTLVGGPTAVSWNTGPCGGPSEQECHIDVFSRASDNNLWQKPYRNGWSGWINLGSPPGGVQSDPDVAARDFNRLDVFALGANGYLYQKSWYGQSPWGAWTSRGRPSSGALLSAPGAISWGPGRIDVFARGQGDDLYQIVWTGSDPWTPWANLCAGSHPPCDITTAPAVSSWAPNRLDVFARGVSPAYHLYHRVYDSGWAGWEDLCLQTACTVASDPGAVSWGWGRIDAFVRGPTNDLQHKRYGW